MKKVLLIIISLFCYRILVGCSHSNDDTRYIKKDVKIFDSILTQRILIDKETGVQYIYCSNGRGISVSVRLDADGKPLLAEDWR